MAGMTMMEPVRERFSEHITPDMLRVLPTGRSAVLMANTSEKDAEDVGA